jgi:hypothetical protein
MKATVPLAIIMIARPISELVSRLRALLALSVLPLEVIYWTPATMIEITATNPPILRSMSKTAKPTNKISPGKLKLITQFLVGSKEGVGWIGKYSHQLGKKKKVWLQVIAAK